MMCDIVSVLGQRSNNARTCGNIGDALRMCRGPSRRFAARPRRVATLSRETIHSRKKAATIQPFPPPPVTVDRIVAS
jgi:hypothetical protein